MHVALKMKMWQTMMFTNSVKVASQKGKWFNLAFLYHTLICKLKFVTSSSQWLILYQAKNFPLQIFDACGILLPFSHLQINTKQFKKWRVKKVQEFPNEEILLQFLRVQNNHLNLHIQHKRWSCDHDHNKTLSLADVGKIQINFIGIVLTSPIVSGNAQWPFFT
jgi:hypothetical protein